MRANIFGIVMILVALFSLTFVFAHGLDDPGQYDVELMTDHMDDMHEIMIKNLEPELKEEMNKMHDLCQNKGMR